MDKEITKCKFVRNAWHDVNKKLPRVPVNVTFKTVIVRTENKFITSAVFYNDTKSFYQAGILENVTHWMELPKFPGDKVENGMLCKFRRKNETVVFNNKRKWI